MARAFDDVSSQYLYRSTPILTATPISMSALFYVDDLTLAQNVVGFSSEDDNSYHGFWLHFRGDEAGDYLQARCYDGGLGIAASTIGVSADTWHHGVARFTSPTDRSVLLDGGNKGTNATSVTPLSIDNATIGAIYYWATSENVIATPLSGRIAEVGIWNISLTDAEATILALGYSPLLIRPQNLVAYWPLIGKNSPEIDLVGGYDMTLINTPTTAVHPSVRYAVEPSLALPAAPLYTKSLVMLQALQGIPTTSNYATLALRNRHPVLAFDDTINKSIVFDFVMPQLYSGGGIAVILHSSAATATSGNAKAGVSLERVGDSQQDVDSDGFAGVNNRTFLVPATSGYVKQTRIQFANGVDMDSIAAGEKFRLKVTRLASGAADNMSGDWELHTAEIRGT